MEITTTELGLAARVEWLGDLDLDDLQACYRRAHVFVSASRRETYGMALADALAGTGDLLNALIAWERRRAATLYYYQLVSHLLTPFFQSRAAPLTCCSRRARTVA